ncbi:Cell wall-associated hydrolase, NlpC family [Pseudonocardia thermophila]|uniref:Cell wall-associated hydrolase, NlpC family n=1 Tax=Pseudonocardia thermophila TaxID=1848 RepID=A0A1M6VLW0_PSETH|nr:C40 family peptidase [Pseudonocardia thermophila]SHK82335.1 Cell wall-associated hydrolase, NlpC family [Pseudonocardia thermophila]
MRTLRPLRLLVPVVAIFSALALFLGIGFAVFTAGLGSGGATGGGWCDVGSAGGRGATVTAAQLTEEQRQNATTILGVVKQKGLPPRAGLIALATAMQESTLRNLHYGDRDSLGLFQQRPSQGWGSPAQVTDPVYATSIFLDRLVQIPGWETLPVTVAAQAVQRSAFPNAYAKWEPLAAELVAQIGAVAAVGPAAACAPAVLAEGVAAAAIRFALGEVGKPYVWGATGPDTYDCSGLMMAAFRAAGITLPRVSRQQFHAGGHVPVREAQPGDLLFYAYDPTDPSTIHHVMLYMGNGQMIEAPYSGERVRVQPVPWDYYQLVPLATRPGTKPNAV